MMVLALAHCMWADNFSQQCLCWLTVVEVMMLVMVVVMLSCRCVLVQQQQPLPGWHHGDSALHLIRGCRVCAAPASEAKVAGGHLRFSIEMFRREIEQAGSLSFATLLRDHILTPQSTTWALTEVQQNVTVPTMAWMWLVPQPLGCWQLSESGVLPSPQRLR